MVPSDAMDTLAKFVCPTVANGKVYIGNSAGYGQLRTHNTFAFTPTIGATNDHLEFHLGSGAHHCLLDDIQPHQQN